MNCLAHASRLQTFARATFGASGLYPIIANQPKYPIFSFLRCNSTSAKDDSVTQSATAIISSCKKGTVLKGINVLKDGQDPVAMDDSEYPAWLWKLLDPKPDYLALEDKLDINYLRTITRAKIRANTLAKQTKSF